MEGWQGSSRDAQRRTSRACLDMVSGRTAWDWPSGSGVGLSSVALVPARLMRTPIGSRCDPTGCLNTVQANLAVTVHSVQENLSL